MGNRGSRVIGGLSMTIRPGVVIASLHVLLLEKCVAESSQHEAFLALHRLKKSLNCRKERRRSRED